MRGARAALERSAADPIKRPLLAPLKFHQVVGTRYINSDCMRKKVKAACARVGWTWPCWRSWCSCSLLQ